MDGKSEMPLTKKKKMRQQSFVKIEQSLHTYTHIFTYKCTHARTHTFTHALTILVHKYILGFLPGKGHA